MAVHGIRHGYPQKVKKKKEILTVHSEIILFDYGQQSTSPHDPPRFFVLPESQGLT